MMLKLFLYLFYSIMAVYIWRAFNGSKKNNKSNYNKKININFSSKELFNKKYLKIEKLERKHEKEQCKYSYNDQPFLYNPQKEDIDELAELRKRNDRHEQHLKQRVL